MVSFLPLTDSYVASASTQIKKETEREWTCERVRILAIADHTTASMAMKKTVESVFQFQRLEEFEEKKWRTKAYSGKMEELGMSNEHST